MTIDKIWVRLPYPTVALQRGFRDEALTSIYMQTAIHIAKTIAQGIRRDIRVRWGLGAGASVLLSAGVLGMGGSLTPGFLMASTTSQVAEVAPLSPAPQAPIIFPVQDKDEGFLVDRSTSTVAEIIGSLPKASRYELLAYNSGLSDTLKQAGTVTVFVPASAQFDYLPRGYVSKLTRPEARQLALAHIVERALPLEESLSGSVYTAGNTIVNFNVEGENRATIGDARILKAYKAKNGYVYIIDRVLVP
ncbi:MAG: hypothetical protein JWL87_237 [Candidatus Adlerbacteria bacterium]|nr:hypothetical protein [Candidatus Adlerbacteria bacterium]